MIKSMTAYGRASVSAVQGQFVIEIHSVNRKMLDMSLYLPKDLLRFDIEIRKWLSQYLERGQITLRLTLQSEGGSNKLFSNYSIQLKALKEGWDKLARELGYDPEKTVDLSFLVSQLQGLPSFESKEDEETLKASLKAAVEAALQELMEMKETGGKTLALDIQKRLKIIEENIAAIELKKEVPLIHYRKKLNDRLKEVGHLHAEAEERIIREVALLAEKMDVTEEIVRLRTHIEQFRQHLSLHEKAVGRTLDFLTQEMHREINTLGSKSADSEISLYVVKIKSELDKIREQVQNIE
jgi:uncharacterized protein (TIGR00255 family)